MARRRRRSKSNHLVQTDPTREIRHEMVGVAIQRILDGDREGALDLMIKSCGVCAAMDHSPIEPKRVWQKARALFGKLGVPTPFTASIGRAMLQRAA